MERVEKINSSSFYKSHSFPAIQDAQQVDVKEDPECSDEFRPLYQQQHSKMKLQSICTRPDDDGDAGHDPLVEARKQGFERGLEEGKTEACKMAHQELEPSLNQLSKAFESLFHCHNHVSRDYAHLIVKLSMALAEKIIGDRTHTAAETLEAVRLELETSLDKHHQLIMQLNSEDLSAFEELINCRDIEINGSSAIQIRDEGTAQKGQPIAVMPQGSFESLMANFETKIDALISAS